MSRCLGTVIVALLWRLKVEGDAMNVSKVTGSVADANVLRGQLLLDEDTVAKP
jgi:hypothetical protein